MVYLLQMASDSNGDGHRAKRSEMFDLGRVVIDGRGLTFDVLVFQVAAGTLDALVSK